VPDYLGSKSTFTLGSLAATADEGAAAMFCIWRRTARRKPAPRCLLR
jgi:hypothetical protein